MIRDLQLEIGRQTYESIATSALNSAKAITRRKIAAGDVVESIMSNAFPDANQWPMVALNGYYSTANEVANLASDVNTSMQIGLLVLVEPGEEAYAFEEHAKQYYKDQGYPEDAGTTAAGFGIRRRDETSKTGYTLDRTGENNTYGSTNKVLVPVLDHSTWKSPMLMYDTHVSSTAIDSIIDCSRRHNEDPLSASLSVHSHYGLPCSKPTCSVVTGFRTRGEDLISLIYKPIYANGRHNETKLVGMIGLSVNFKDVLHSVIPDYFDGIHAVISTHSMSENHTNIEYSKATYDIRSGVPQLKGPGDLHLEDFDTYGRSIVLNDISTDASDAVVYTLTIYPSSFSQYRTGSPLVVAIGLAAVILACSIMFFLYDTLMRQESHEQRAILELKRRFVRFISHELRTPLQTVSMGIELLESDIVTYNPRLANKDAKTPTHPVSKGQESTSIPIDEASIRFWHEIAVDIKDNAAGAVSILNDLLNYDKVETGVLHIEAEVVDILQLVKKTAKRFTAQAIQKQVSLTLTTHCPGGVPCEFEVDTALSNLKVLGDSMRLSQVLCNLFSNALKFTPSDGFVRVNVRFCICRNCNSWALLQSVGHVKGRVETDCPVAGSVSIDVVDSGVGMTLNQVELVFKEGVQFDANKLQAGGGSGLGLCISRGIIDRHNGVISAKSEGKGKGSTFSVLLPLYDLGSPLQDSAKQSTAQNVELNRVESTCNSTCSQGQVLDDPVEKAKHDTMESPPPPPPSKSPPPLALPCCRDKPHHDILVVEDVASSRKMLIRLLERAGHTCEPAGDGKEAIQAVVKNMEQDVEQGQHMSIPFDTILIDYEMPICNGPDATEEIRKLGFDGLVFGVTGNLLQEDVEHFLSKGADEVLPKPVTLALINDAWKRHPRQPPQDKVEVPILDDNEIDVDGISV
ncbi:Sensor protein kinase WalK (Fragment) [Seminavis robusta]|uniref:histidine kinase n=1 Tax=Seminavis robusta TaxID=568900 RepID=A0A9N8D839_9STRA